MAHKTGPKPKQLEPFEKMGIPVGRNQTHIDPEEVEGLAALGCSWREIADFFGIHPDTARRNFAAYYTKGSAKAQISLRRAMLHNATQNMNASVQIFLSKNWLGLQDQPISTEDNQILPWTETHQQDQTHQTEVKIGKVASLQVRVD